jgi:membrane protein
MARLSLEKLRKIRQAAEAFLDEQVFLLEEESKIPRMRRFVHFWILIWRSFIANRCTTRAAGLAYTTLLALVPILAFAVSVSTGFLQQQSEERIDYMIDRVVQYIAAPLNLVPHPDEEEAAISRHEVVVHIKQYIENINSGTLGVSAMLVLLFLAISLLNTVEATFNDIWGIIRGRGWLTRIVQYWAAISLAPVLILMAVGLIMGQEVQATQAWIQRVPFLGSLIFFFLPFVILTITCALLYLIIPNTKVSWSAALLGGAVAGCLLQLNTMFSVVYISRVVSYHAIYGSLGLVLLFLVGLYISWVILLFGAQVAYGVQNRKVYLQEKQAELVNHRGREFVALRIMTMLALRFHKGEPPPSGDELANQLGVPLKLVTLVLKTLTQSKLTMEVVSNDIGFSPARPIEQITLLDILTAMRAGQGQEFATCEDTSKRLVQHEYEEVQEAEAKVAGAVTLQDLVEELEHPGTEVKLVKAEPSSL